MFSSANTSRIRTPRWYAATRASATSGWAKENTAIRMTDRGGVELMVLTMWLMIRPLAQRPRVGGRAPGGARVAAGRGRHRDRADGRRDGEQEDQQDAHGRGHVSTEPFGEEE